MKTNNLIYSSTKTYTKSGDTYRLTANVELSDKCKNGICDFAITGNIYKKSKNGRWIHYAGGCVHESILKYFPNLEIFVKLHLCNRYGQPMYSIDNGIYWLKESKKTGMDYLMITEEEADTLLTAVDDKLYFKYLLYSLGIVDRWKKEADKAISDLEEFTGNKWVNPYTPGEERFCLKPLTEEELSIVQERIATGYYSEVSVQERKEATRIELIEKRKAEIISECEKEITKVLEKQNIDLEIANSGILSTNYIYYSHTNTLIFNWNRNHEGIKKEEFNHFMETANFDNLPKDIKIEYKEEGE
jgi:hypothetical protein